MLTPEQYNYLLKPIPKSRVSERKGLGYVEAWEIKRHLTRIFGFGGWSADLLSNDLVFAELSDTPNTSGKYNWDVAYKAVMQLTIHGIAPDGGDVTYTEAAIGASHQPDKADSHDMACKTAESDALKRCAINLGTQFGLSLYDNGSLVDVVVRTLRPPEGWTAPETTQGATQSDETPTPAAQPAPDSPGAQAWAEKIAGCADIPEVLRLRASIVKAKALNDTYRGVTLGKHLDAVVASMSAK